MINFRQPYLAESLQDFWRRWHISLSSWLRDYLYIPLGGSRLGSIRTYANLMITMLLGGLWHGANWTFVVWGGIHGAGLAMERLSGLVGSHVFRSILGRWIRRVIIFHLVCFAWIFFRSPSFGMAWGFLAGLGDWQWKSVYGLALLFLMAHVIVLLFIDLHLEHSGGEYLLEKRPLIARVTCGLLLCVFITLFGANQTNAFIYFQF
jgi:D-alanyl-lipoteichoic acid acyltransferase DltB (MBOAT superfamily)